MATHILIPISVHHVAVDEAQYGLNMTASARAWKDVFQTFELSFGASDDSPGVRDQTILKKRQGTQSAGATTFSPTISIPTPPSSSPTPKEDTAQKAIDFQFLDTAILPPDIPGVDSATLHGPLVYVLYFSSPMSIWRATSESSQVFR